MQSVIQQTKECFACGKKYDLQLHHIYRTPYRNNSTKYGMVVWLCFDHHTGNNGVHNGNTTLDLYLKQTGQRKFEETHTRREFIQKFGRSYL